MLKKISTLLFPLLALFFAAPHALAQNAPAAGQSGDGIALAPARFELEMTPGSETTVVVNLDYHTSRADAQPYRLVASLNDWDMNEKGELGFYKAGARPLSASPWIIYSPAEVTVQPGQTHSIRVTITVPKDATPGDHLAALIVEQRPDTIKLNRNARQMVMRFRMASMFYITVPRATRRGTLANLQARTDARGIVVTPTLKNEGNSVVRPISSIKVVDASGRTVAELPEGEALPVLAGATLSQPLVIEKALAPGTYTVKYRVDFQDGGKVTEGVTDLTIQETKENATGTSASSKRPD
ncbi:MAG TPA: copper resistance protein CopC [Pyrinomonadaceae bacterium]|nr:copper resistance protein CopC [Pyrinomonadaceae bacterium]